MSELAQATIQPETRTFLDGMEAQYTRAVLDDELAPVRDRVRAWGKAIFDDLDAYSQMAAAETDPVVRGCLSEYEQKLGAMDRELRALRDKVGLVVRIAGEIEELETRVGVPLRTATVARLLP